MIIFIFKIIVCLVVATFSHGFLQIGFGMENDLWRLLIVGVVVFLLWVTMDFEK